jgi:Tol biopolymer transport system component
MSSVPLPLFRVFGSCVVTLLLLLGFGIGAARALGSVTPRAQLAYAAMWHGNSEIYLLDVHHRLAVNLTRTRAYDAAPAWSPDGEWLAFTSDRDGIATIYTMHWTGAHVQRLVHRSGAWDGARWSGDGQRIAFFERSTINPNMYGIRRDGSGFEQLTDDETPAVGVLMDLGIEPNARAMVGVAATGQLLALRFDGVQWSIFINDGSLPVTRFSREGGWPLAHVGRAYNEMPLWSPSGDRIAYLATMPNDWRTDVYVITPAHGATPVRMTHTGAYESGLRWRPG